MLGRDQRHHILQRHGSIPTRQPRDVMRALHNPPRRRLITTRPATVPRPIDLPADPYPTTAPPLVPTPPDQPEQQPRHPPDQPHPHARRPAPNTGPGHRPRRTIRTEHRPLLPTPALSQRHRDNITPHTLRQGRTLPRRHHHTRTRTALRDQQHRPARGIRDTTPHELHQPATSNHIPRHRHPHRVHRHTHRHAPRRGRWHGRRRILMRIRDRLRPLRRRYRRIRRHRSNIQTMRIPTHSDRVHRGIRIAAGHPTRRRRLPRKHTTVGVHDRTGPASLRQRRIRGHTRSMWGHRR